MLPMFLAAITAFKSVVMFFSIILWWNFVCSKGLCSSQAGPVSASAVKSSQMLYMPDEFSHRKCLQGAPQYAHEFSILSPMQYLQEEVLFHKRMASAQLRKEMAEKRGCLTKTLGYYIAYALLYTLRYAIYMYMRTCNGTSICSIRSHLSKSRSVC